MNEDFLLPAYQKLYAALNSLERFCKGQDDTVSKSVSQLSFKKGPAMFGQSREVCNFGCPNLKLQLMLLTKEQIAG